MARKKPDERPLRVRRLGVEGLFGLYNHDIPLCVEDRVTILHGPNGVGKTALLRLLAGIFTGHYADFAKYPVKSFKVEFMDGTWILVRPAGARGKNGRKPPLEIVHSAEKEPATIRLDSHEVVETARMAAIEQLPLIVQVDDDQWLDRQTGDLLTGLEVLRFPALSPRLRGQRRYDEPPWLRGLRQRLNVHVIETQRLLRMGPVGPLRLAAMREPVLSTVRDDATDLSSKIKDTLARYARKSQELDQSFPQRLLNPVGSASKSREDLEDLKQRMTALAQKRDELQHIGLLDRTSTFDIASLDKLMEGQVAAMSLYIEDTDKKLEVLTGLARRITLLRDKVNSKFQHKKLRIDQEKGFVAVDHGGESELDLDSLSSGEQHELVLLYDLLFRVRRGALVLIDEPELSLHVAWQKQFLPDLLEIVEIAELDAILATHSPFIVGDREDLLVELAGKMAP